MKSGITKGEWRVGHVNTNGQDGYEIHCTDDGECITDHVYELSDANLIAAAPELLEALQCFLEEGECQKSIKKAEQALKKALQ